MSEYTPTTEEVRDHWVNVGFAGDADSFNRWLEAHDRQVAAEAVADAADEFESGLDFEEFKHRTEQAPKGWTDESITEAIQGSGPIMDWLRARAASIASEPEADRG